MLLSDYLPEEILHRPGHRGWFTVVDGRGRIRWQYKEYPDPAWAGWYALVLACRETPVEYLAFLQREKIPYLVAGQARVDLACALEKMLALLGVKCVISTAGGKLNGALLRLGLVDEVTAYMAPMIFGGASAPTLAGGPGLERSEAIPLKLVSAEAWEDGGVYLKYILENHG
jgi:riboflavin biosynthesis pyrimidine reductase